MAFQFKPKNYDAFRWVSLVAGMILLMTCTGHIWSLLVDPMINERGASDAFMAGCYSGLTVVGMIFTVVGGKLVDKLGANKMTLISMICYFIGNILCGISHNIWVFAIAQVIFVGFQQSVLYISVLATASTGFPDHRGVAMGFTTAGVSLGGMIISPLCQAAMDTFGFDAMFFIIGGSCFVVSLICVFLNPDPPQNYKPAGYVQAEAEEAEDKKKTRFVANPDFVQKGNVEMFKDPAFYMLFAILLLGVTGFMLLSYQMSYIAQDILGIEPIEAAFLVSGVSACGFAAKIIGGFISDLIGRLNWVPICLLFSTIAIGGLIFSGSHGIVWFAVCCFAYCFFMGSLAGSTGPLTNDLFGGEHFGSNFSIVYIGVLVAATISPWLAVVGRTTGDSPDYVPIFMLCTVMCTIGFVISLILRHIRNGKTEYILRKKDAE